MYFWWYVTKLSINVYYFPRVITNNYYYVTNFKSKYISGFTIVIN